MTCHGKARGQKHAAEIQRVSRVGVRARSCQLLMFAQMSRGIGAYEQSQRGDRNSEKKKRWLRSSKPKCRNANRVSDANSPANPKISCAAHAEAIRQQFAACNTCSTVIRTMAGEK